MIPPMAEGASHFSDDPAAARARFLAACDRIGLRVDSFPGHDPGGAGAPVRAPVHCDVARLGSPEAERMLVLFPAAGGGAGFAGAGCVTGVLAGGLIRELPREVSCLLVHAVNPTGPAWPGPAGAPDPASDDEGQDGATSPGPDWSDGMLSAAERRFAAYEQAQRFDRERLAGRTLASLAPPAWGHAVLEAIAARHLTGKRRLLFLDVRTGPGPFGEIERTAPAGAGTGSAEAAMRWTGLDLPRGTAPSAPATAAPAGGLPALVGGPGVEKATILLEAGTYSMATLLQASGPMRETGAPREGGAIAAYPREAAWREQLWEAAGDLIRRGFRGLAAAD